LSGRGKGATERGLGRKGEAVAGEAGQGWFIRLTLLEKTSRITSLVRRYTHFPFPLCPVRGGRCWLLLSSPSFGAVFEGEGVDPDKPVTVEIQYPAVGASERFLLLTNRNGDDEYEPIMEIVKIVRTVLESKFLFPSRHDRVLVYFRDIQSSSWPLASTVAYHL
jgi:hypothetical protein